MKSRQVERAEFRAEMKRGRQMAAQRGRQNAKRALLARQTERENAGFYTGRGVNATRAPSRSRVTSRRIKKGVEFGRIIKKIVGHREFFLHATKGWRSRTA
jgi:hypothetical protein